MDLNKKTYKTLCEGAGFKYYAFIDTALKGPQICASQVDDFIMAAQDRTELQDIRLHLLNTAQEIHKPFQENPLFTFTQQEVILLKANEQKEKPLLSEEHDMKLNAMLEIIILKSGQKQVDMNQKSFATPPLLTALCNAATKELNIKR